MAASIPGCHLWQREAFPWRDICSPTMYSFKCNRTAQHLFYTKRKSHSIQHIPRSKPTHLLQQLLEILSIINERKVFPWGLIWVWVTKRLLFFSHKRSSVFVIAKLARNDCVWYGRWKGPWQPICWALPLLFFVYSSLSNTCWKPDKILASIISCSD